MKRVLTAALMVLALTAPGAHAAERPDVVLLMLDELPLDSLLEPDGHVDAARFPNFARLAAGSTWFRNAYSAYDSTPKAIPLILDGRTPFRGMLADLRDHPTSIYTALARRGYRVVDSEEATSLCPPSVCPGALSHRPGILAHLNRRRPERFAAWLRTIRRGEPTLYVKHLLLPHGPWMFRPSGKQTRPAVTDAVPGLAGPRGFGGRYATAFNRARHLLQLGFADRLVGQMLDRLESTGVHDDALVMVVADHGYAWEIGVDDRRRVTEGNVDEIAPVPMFLKAPGQRRSRVSDAYVSTLDVLPTIADVLDVGLGYRADGRSAFTAAVRRRRAVRLPDRDFTQIVAIGARRLERLRKRNRREAARLVGTGLGSTIAYGGPWAALFRVGPNPELVGRRVGDFLRGQSGRARAGIVNARLSRAVDTASQLVPAEVGGRIAGGRPGAEREIAVAVNGRIEAVGRSFRLEGDPRESFALNLPERVFHDGRNDVRVFEVTRRGGAPSLVLLSSN